MKVQYICDGCGEKFSDINEAISCEQSGEVERICEVGDIVTGEGGFGWYDGDSRWITNPNVQLHQKPCPNKNGNCFSDCCTYFFYYVVTAIDQHKHRIRYHLTTRAMKESYRQGHTFNKHHVQLIKVEDPSDYLVRSGRSLIGEKSEYLL